MAEVLKVMRERNPNAWVVFLHQRSLSASRLSDLVGDAKAIAPQLHYRTVILPTSLGGLNGAGMLEEPESKTGEAVAVRDVADFAPTIDDVAQLPDRRRVILTCEQGNEWRYRILGAVNSMPDSETSPAYPMWTAARDAIGQSFHMTCIAQYIMSKNDAGPNCRLLLYQKRKTPQKRGDNQRVTIIDHNAAVGRINAAIQQQLQLPKLLDRAFQFAAIHHDLGKDDPRWQQAIGNGGSQDRLAKSCGQGFNWRALNGYRHEFGSLRAIAEVIPNDETRDLALHLIAAHHGRGRPHFDMRGMADRNGLSENLHELLQPAAVARRFARLQRRYGHWGLAWLESILMAADAAGSRLPADTAVDEIEEDEE